VKKIFDNKVNDFVTIISQGEYVVTSKDEIFSTILGSCVSVCIFDPIVRVAGMNHFLLPEPAVIDDNIHIEKAKYGINAIEMMINDMLKLGSNKKNLKAKLFGGSNLLKYPSNSAIIEVGKQNVAFAIKYLDMEKINLLSSDTHGDAGRKIYFNTETYEVKLFRLEKENKNIQFKEKVYQTSIKNIETELRKAMQQKMNDKSRITLFDKD
jgi:chemotaxis protein CheD